MKTTGNYYKQMINPYRDIVTENHQNGFNLFETMGKRLSWILVAAMVLVGCDTREPYQRIIEEYLKQHLKDPSSYECVEFGSPKIITPMSRALVETTRRSLAGEFPADSISSKLDQIKAYFISQGTEPYDTLGWEVHHKYRAKNSYGALDLEEVVYILDKSQSKIIDTERK